MSNCCIVAIGMGAISKRFTYDGEGGERFKNGSSRRITTFSSREQTTARQNQIIGNENTDLDE